MLVAILVVKGVQGATEERLAKAERAAELRAAGWLQREIAADLGISRSYVHDLLHDPDGSKGRARKDSYSQPCPGCGAPLSGSDGPAGLPELCAACMTGRQHAERYWTADRIMEAFRAFAERFGRPPSASDTNGLMPSQVVKLSDERIAELREVRDSGFELPHPYLAKREFGSWKAALAAAGFDISRGGGSAHRSNYRRQKRPKSAPRREQILALLAERPHTLAELDAAANGVSARSAIRDLQRLGRIENVAGHGNGREAVYQLTPQENRSTEMSETDGSIWIVFDAETDQEINRVSAPNRILAIERAAKKPGSYRAIRVRDWEAFDVGVTERLTVMPKDASGSGRSESQA